VRIALVVHGYPPDDAAGVELVAAEQAEALARRGHETWVFARAPGETIRESEQGGVRVWRVPAAPGAISRLEHTWENRAFDAAFDRFLDAARPDVVHVHHLVLLSSSLIDVARRRGLPVALSVHDGYYLCHRLFWIDDRGERCAGPDGGARCAACLEDLGGRDVARDRFELMARRLAAVSALIAPSRALAERYLADLPFLADRVEIVDPGLAQAPARRARGGTEASDVGPLRLAFIGTWLPHKGLDLLLAALREVDSARYRLAVHGAAVAGREAWVADLVAASRDLPVDWSGAFAPEHLADVLREADVLVLPSRCDESYSRVVREARAAGLAVIAPGTGGPAEALRDGVDALLVAPGSQADLAAALRRLVDDRALVRRLAEAPASFPTPDDAAARLEAIYGVIRAAATASVACGAGSRPRVTVAYVTKNGVELLADSLAAVRAQAGDVEIAEVLAIDSGSTDGTLDILARHGVRVIEIPAHEFGHGRTRNLAAREARGDYVAFLTQDATPAHDRWLERLVAPFASDPLLAGTWSRHVPRAGCHPMEWRRVVSFPLFHGPPLCVSWMRGGGAAGQGAELQCWFSNNASAMPRALLLRWPFPEVEFAEDQAWARDVLEAGFRTALVNDSVVVHSHAYSPWTNLQRNFDNACAMREALGRQDGLSAAECVRAAVRETGRDIAFWAAERGRSQARVAARWALPAIAYHLGAFGGRWLGSRATGLPSRVKHRLSLRERQRSR
jgi:rhamnosyltransferase